MIVCHARRKERLADLQTHGGALASCQSFNIIRWHANASLGRVWTCACVAAHAKDAFLFLTASTPIPQVLLRELSPPVRLAGLALLLPAAQG